MDKYLVKNKRPREEDDKVPIDISSAPSYGPSRPLLQKYPQSTLGSSHGRSFTSSWYDSYTWMEYSAIKDAVYCFACRHFKQTMCGHTETAFTNEGFSYWKNATSKFKSHEAAVGHKCAMQA